MENNFYDFVDSEIQKALPQAWKKLSPKKLAGRGPYKIRHAFHSSPLNDPSKMINILPLSMSVELDDLLEYHLLELRDYILSKEGMLVVITEEEQANRLDDMGVFIEEQLSIEAAGFLWITCSRDQDYKTMIEPEIFEDLHAPIHDLWKGTLYYDGPSAGLQKVNVELMRDECWKCHKPMTTVTGLVFPNVQLDRWDNEDWSYYNQLLSLANLKGENAQSIQEFVSLLRTVDTTITPVGNRYSPSEKISSTVARCPHCKASLGDFYVADYRMRYLHSLDSRMSGELKYYSISLNIDQKLINSLRDGFEGCDHTCINGWKRE